MRLKGGTGGGADPGMGSQPSPYVKWDTVREKKIKKHDSPSAPPPAKMVHSNVALFYATRLAQASPAQGCFCPACHDRRRQRHSRDDACALVSRSSAHLHCFRVNPLFPLSDSFSEKQKKNLQMHKEKLAKMKPNVDNKAPPRYNHLVGLYSC
jgi:hypothetical protein